MEETNISLEKSLSGAAVTGTEDGMIQYSAGSCDRCDCVCNQPCHGEGPCYRI